jgi:hypothetical protein
MAVCAPCGSPCQPKDCPREYSLAEVNASAARWRPDDASNAAVMERKHQDAKAQCHAARERGVAESGGWCLNSTLLARTSNNWVLLPHNMSYRLPRKHFAADSNVLAALDRLLSPTAAHGRLSLIDFGAGIGQYARGLLGRSHIVRPYDGAGDVEEFTGGLVRFADLTAPALALPRADWVLSTEVGEHIPHAREANFVRNLHAHNRCGLILSWAQLSQRGLQHINNHSPAYLAQLMSELGYFVHTALSADLRGRGPLGRARDMVPRGQLDPGRSVLRNVHAYVRHGAGIDCGVG